MERNNRNAAIGVLVNSVASALAYKREPEALDYAGQLATRQAGQAGHDYTSTT